ncbi:MAG TPA: glycosyltransferase family 39 protein [Nitrospiria bacterium]|nr:glycosyltransferase family 39 protein [Nitrospiria bacterium]
MSRAQDRYDRWIDLGWMVFLVALAFALRAIYGSARTILADHDSAGYIMGARGIFRGEVFFSMFKPPGYPILVGLWSMVVGDDVVGARIASIVCGSLLCAVAYLLGKHLYGRPTGIAAGLLTAVSLIWIQKSSDEIDVSTYVLVILASTALIIIRLGQDRPGIWAAAGLLFGLSYWVRQEGVFYLAFIPAAAFVDHWVQTGKVFTRTYLIKMAAFIFAGLIPVLPYVWHIHQEKGIWTISPKTVWAALVYSTEIQENQLATEQAVYGLTPDKKNIRLRGSVQSVSMISNFAGNLAFKVKETVKNWYKTYDLLLLVYPLILWPFVGIGLYQLKWSLTDRRPEIYLLAFLVPWICIYPLYEVASEKLAQVVPVLNMWAGLGIVSVATRIGRQGADRPFAFFRKPAMVTGGIVLLVTLLQMPGFLEPLRDPGYFDRYEDDPVNKVVADWIRKNLPADTVLMERKTFIGMYADRKQVELPFADYADMITYARYQGVNVIVMDEKFKAIRPQLAFLFDAAKPPDDLVPIYETQNKSGKKIILYKLLPKPMAAEG